MIPEELRYTEDHVWVATRDDDVVRVGITEDGQDELGDLVSVRLPELGDRVAAGAALGSVAADGATAEVVAPVGGEVVAVNVAVDVEPDLVNSDPYGEGWLVEIRLDDPDAVEALLDADAYQVVTRS